MSEPAAEATHLECESCGAGLQFSENERAVVCPYCGTPSVVQRPDTVDRPVPTFTVGFVLGQKQARDHARQWMGRSSIFARSGFRKAPLEAIRSVYLPAYLYGAVARSQYSAQIGENYTVTETYTTTDSKGKTVTRTRTRVKTEWRHLDGVHAAYLKDVIVTASRAIKNNELQRVEPFDLRALRRHDAKLVVGWTTEEPSMTSEESLAYARIESQQMVGSMLKAFMPGDSHTDLRYDMAVENEVFDLVLLPLWVFAVRYDSEEEPVRVLVNGQTGKVGGKVPLSKWKIGTAITLGVGALVGLIYWWATQ